MLSHCTTFHFVDQDSDIRMTRRVTLLLSVMLSNAEAMRWERGGVQQTNWCDVTVGCTRPRDSKGRIPSTYTLTHTLQAEAVSGRVHKLLNSTDFWGEGGKMRRCWNAFDCSWTLWSNRQVRELWPPSSPPLPPSTFLGHRCLSLFSFVCFGTFHYPWQPLALSVLCVACWLPVVSVERLQ